jgi:hypothetical protein
MFKFRCNVILTHANRQKTENSLIYNTLITVNSYNSEQLYKRIIHPLKILFISSDIYKNSVWMKFIIQWEGWYKTDILQYVNNVDSQVLHLLYRHSVLWTGNIRKSPDLAVEICVSKSTFRVLHKSNMHTSWHCSFRHFVCMYVKWRMTSGDYCVLSIHPHILFPKSFDVFGTEDLY